MCVCVVSIYTHIDILLTIPAEAENGLAMGARGLAATNFADLLPGAEF